VSAKARRVEVGEGHVGGEPHLAVVAQVGDVVGALLLPRRPFDQPSLGSQWITTRGVPARGSTMRTILEGRKLRSKSVKRGQKSSTRNDPVAEVKRVSRTLVFSR
jgi:hypothetical protein